jgi:glycosyltransferase involved in cell wall biosynthesis
MKPSVLFFAYHFAPSNEIGARRPAALAAELIRRGYEVLVVSAFEGAGPEQLEAMRAEGYVPVRVVQPRKFMLSSLARFKQSVKALFTVRKATTTTTEPPSLPAKGQENLLVKIATLIDTHKLWTLYAARAASQEIGRKRPDAVYCTAPPFSALLAAAWVATRNRLPLIVDLRDAWMVGGTQTRSPTGLSAWVYHRLERAVFRRARGIFVTASGLADKYRAAFPTLADRIHTVRNGYDGEPLPSITDTGHRLHILFAGEIYVNRDPFGFLEALERLLQRPDVEAAAIEVTFVGRCESYRGRPIKDWLHGKKAEQVVKVLPPVPRAEVLRMTQAATVMLNFAQGTKTMIPAKSYDQMASGREVLLLCETDSDTGRLFEGRQGVLRVDPAFPVELDDALLALYQRHVSSGHACVPTAADVTEFSRSFQTGLYADLMESLCQDS